ncbi:MAG: hypothetical protein QOF11_68 [Chloroflexota bacterium]|jgi:hypothetical protein|nr:hypothetical protein [Chloroflexota bacterium]
MPRRWVETLVALVAVAVLGLVLYNATMVDRRPPTVRITLSATAGDEHVAQTLAAIDLEFSEPVDPASVERRFQIEPHVGGTFTWDRDTEAIFTPARKLPSDTEFSVSVASGFSDRAGNQAPDPAGPFSFRTIGPPVVTALSPPAGASGIATNAAAELTFDRLMDTASVETAIAIQPAVPFTLTWSGPRLSIAFGSPLAFGTTYSITVGSAAADTDGSHLATPFSASFTTVAAGVGVKSVVPADGVSGIGIRTPIAIVFDGPIDPTSVVGALRLTPEVNGDARVIAPANDLAPTVPSPSASAVPASPDTGPAGSGTVLVFTPSGPLAQHTTYTVELEPVVRSAGDPDQVAAGRTWTFTTGGQPTSAQNQIAFLSARGGVRNLWLMNPDGSNPRQVTTELTPVTGYDVTSDGRSVVYGAGGQVRVLRLSTGTLTTLTAAGRFEYAPVLAPGGGQVLVGRRDGAGGDLGYWLVPMPGADGGPERQVLPDGAPPLGSVAADSDRLELGPDASVWAGQAAFDPTGASVVVVDGQDRVVRAALEPVAAPPVVEVVDVTGPIGAPVWADSVGSVGGPGAFLIVGKAAGGAGLIRLDRPRSALSPAAGPVAVAGHGGIATLVAPAGSHLGYTSLASRVAEPLTSAADLLDRAPGFSPDGLSLLFGRVLASDPTRSAGIWLVGLDGRDLRQLSVDGSSARWLP